MSPMTPVMVKTQSAVPSTEEQIDAFRADQIQKAKEANAASLQEQKALAKKEQAQAQQEQQARNAQPSTVVSLSQEGLAASKKAE